MKIIYIPIITAACGFCSAQTTLYFKYDEAGNQKYRGPDATVPEAAKKPQQTQIVMMPDEKKDEKFWSGIRMYPVPVKDVLTIDWNDENDELIESVWLYEHNRVHFVFQQKNLPNINKQVQINMTGMYMGVYIVSFKLKNGNTISKNIIKE